MISIQFHKLSSRIYMRRERTQRNIQLITDSASELAEREIISLNTTGKLFLLTRQTSAGTSLHLALFFHSEAEKIESLLRRSRSSFSSRNSRNCAWEICKLSFIPGIHKTR